MVIIFLTRAIYGKDWKGCINQNLALTLVRYFQMHHVCKWFLSRRFKAWIGWHLALQFLRNSVRFMKHRVFYKSTINSKVIAKNCIGPDDTCHKWVRLTFNPYPLFKPFFMRTPIFAVVLRCWHLWTQWSSKLLDTQPKATKIKWGLNHRSLKIASQGSMWGFTLES